MSAVLLARLLVRPQEAAGVRNKEWTGIISAARQERLLATLACRLEGVQVPREVERIFADALVDADRDRRQALWEVDRTKAALGPLGIRVILLKGTAYIAAVLKAGEGRMIGDLDILVPRDRLAEAEAALLAAGWEWVKPDPYDDAYYRRWMHELPPMIHRTRDRMIDVHRTILPLTAKVAPDASALIADAVELSDGVAILSPEDRVCHAVAHLLADGDLSGGLRNLWDIRCLMNDVDNISDLEKRAALHGLSNQLSRARRLVCALFGEKTRLPPRIADRIFAVRLLSRDGWGRDSRKWLGFAFYIRSHFLRMPPLMLARHLWTKWSRGYRPG